MDLDTSQEGALAYEEFLVIDEVSQTESESVMEEGWLDHTVETPFVRSVAPSDGTIRMKLVDTRETERETDHSIYDRDLVAAFGIVVGALVFLIAVVAWKKCREMRQVKAAAAYKPMPIYRPSRKDQQTNRSEHRPFHV